jgi:hypothetical protein
VKIKARRFNTSATRLLFFAVTVCEAGTNFVASDLELMGYANTSSILSRRRMPTCSLVVAVGVGLGVMVVGVKPFPPGQWFLSKAQTFGGAFNGE